MSPQHNLDQETQHQRKGLGWIGQLGYDGSHVEQLFLLQTQEIHLQWHVRFLSPSFSWLKTNKFMSRDHKSISSPSTSTRSIASPFFKTGLLGELTRSAELLVGELKGEELVTPSTAAEPELNFLSVNCSTFGVGECIALSSFDCIISGD